jgi:hypothetical protein
MDAFLALITPITTPTTPPQPPLGFWGPNDPRPTNPIAGWNPGTGTFPPFVPPMPPLVIWGPGDPRPTLPIAGWDPGTGAFPKPPQPPGMPGQLPASNPDGGWVWGFVPGYGWMWAYSPAKPPAPPVTDPPHPDHTLPGDLPPDPVTP